MGCGQVVRRLILAQEIVGSNPTTPANKYSRLARLFLLGDTLVMLYT
jgi:hypothetical protein